MIAKPADHPATFPVVEDAVDGLAHDAGHGGEVALADLLADENAASADVRRQALLVCAASIIRLS